MAYFLERFIKGKRFSQEFDFDDTANQVIPKVGAGSVIGDILASIWTALSGKHPEITGGSDGQVYTVQPDGSYAWEGVASQIQTLGISGQTLSISGGNSVTLPDKDQQTLSVSGQTLSISGGNSITLPSGVSSFGGVGTYLFAVVQFGTTLPVGTVLSGASLSPGQVYTDNVGTSFAIVVGDGTTMSGSWRIMGTLFAYGTNPRATLALRIA